MRGELGVRCCCAAIEDDLRVLGRIQGGQHHWGEPIAGADIGGVDTPVAQLAPYVVAELLATDLRGDSGMTAQPRGGDGDVGGRAADRLGEGLRVEEAGIDLLRIEVDADTTDGDDLRDGVHGSTMILW